MTNRAHWVLKSLLYGFVLYACFGIIGVIGFWVDYTRKSAFWYPKVHLGVEDETSSFPQITSALLQRATPDIAEKLKQRTTKQFLCNRLARRKFRNASQEDADVLVVVNAKLDRDSVEVGVQISLTESKHASYVSHQSYPRTFTCTFPGTKLNEEHATNLAARIIINLLEVRQDLIE